MYEISWKRMCTKSLMLHGVLMYLFYKKYFDIPIENV